MIYFSACSSSQKTTVRENTNENKTYIPTSSNYEFNELVDLLNLDEKSNPNKYKLLENLVDYLDMPYQYGGNGDDGIDCSALTQQVYLKSIGIKLPRTAREQFLVGERITNVEDLKFGDLVYFDTSKIYFPGHVGIFLGKDLFAHASSSNGVVISSMDNKYFSKKFIGASRLRKSDYH